MAKIEYLDGKRGEHAGRVARKRRVKLGMNIASRLALSKGLQRAKARATRKGIAFEVESRSGRLLSSAAGIGTRNPAKLRDINDWAEDAQLNAIADERAEGPFVSVSLDDL